MLQPPADGAGLANMHTIVVWPGTSQYWLVLVAHEGCRLAATKQACSCWVLPCWCRGLQSYACWRHSIQAPLNEHSAVLNETEKKRMKCTVSC